MAAIRNTSTGEIHFFNKIPYKETNLIKIMVYSDKLWIEEVYAVVDDVVYGNIQINAGDGLFIARIAENCNLFSFKSWGLHVICRYNKKLPYANIDWINYMNPYTRVISPRIEASLPRRLLNFIVGLFC